MSLWLGGDRSGTGRPLKGSPVVQWFAVRDDHVLERSINRSAGSTRSSYQGVKGADGSAGTGDRGPTWRAGDGALDATPRSDGDCVGWVRGLEPPASGTTIRPEDLDSQAFRGLACRIGSKAEVPDHGLTTRCEAKVL